MRGLAALSGLFLLLWGGADVYAQSANLPEPRMQAVNARVFAPKLTTLPHRVAVTPEGAATASVPFELPPARVKPAIGLSYSSHRGHSLDGLPEGWAVAGLMGVRRGPRQATAAFWSRLCLPAGIGPSPLPCRSSHASRS